MFNSTRSLLINQIHDEKGTMINSSHYNDDGDSTDFTLILQQLFGKISNTHHGESEQVHSNLPPKNGDDSHVLALISLWFVLIVNPIVILFGVIGNLLAIYILIRCHILNLPVSFYTIMLNLSNTFNLIIPVLIFWLDNCFNRTAEHGYFRDKSNFLCKALMCPDQLFAALSAWYMCAISFNRWYSVCRPSSYFFGTIVGQNRPSTSVRKSVKEPYLNCHQQKNSSSVPLMSNYISWDWYHWFANNKKYRPHVKAFRSIGIITLLALLFCLNPIFMHEIRSVESTNTDIFTSHHKISRNHPITWKRCYVSQKHEDFYDIIGIILSCLLHILPLTFIAAMSFMIILNLRQRQRQMSSTNPTNRISAIPHQQQSTSTTSLRTSSSYETKLFTNEEIKEKKKLTNMKLVSYQAIWINGHKEKSILVEPQNCSDGTRTSQIQKKAAFCFAKRNQSRDRTITIMLVGVALSYLILTLPYRLFWSYNVYIKTMHPEKIKSSVYLGKMHHIDHILRTIRHIHYGTNFVFFVFLSETFRDKFKELFLQRFIKMYHRLYSKESNGDLQSKFMNSTDSKLLEKPKQTDFLMDLPASKQLFDEESVNADVNKSQNKSNQCLTKLYELKDQTI